MFFCRTEKNAKNKKIFFSYLLKKWNEKIIFIHFHEFSDTQLKRGIFFEKKCSSPFLFFWSILFKFSSSIHFSTRNEHKYSKNIENTWYCGEEENPLNQVSLAFFAIAKWILEAKWRTEGTKIQWPRVFFCVVLDDDEEGTGRKYEKMKLWAVKEQEPKF